MFKFSGQRFSPKSPFAANFAPRSNIKRQAWKETYIYANTVTVCWANGETFDETHARDVPTALQMVTFTKVSKRKKSLKKRKWDESVSE